MYDALDELDYDKDYVAVCGWKQGIYKDCSKITRYIYLNDELFTKPQNKVNYITNYLTGSFTGNLNTNYLTIGTTSNLAIGTISNLAIGTTPYYTITPYYSTTY